MYGIREKGGISTTCGDASSDEPNGAIFGK